jgi:cytochrome c oxidase assembly protein subunit 11
MAIVGSKNMLPVSLASKNRRIGLVIATVVIAMVGMAYAAVPLYSLFCRVTGFGGTTQVATEAPAQALDRKVTVKFNADTARDMPWEFRPEQRETATRIGEKTLIAYEARNPTARAITGTALYNVVPEKAGKYFRKIECFCFNEQTLGPGETARMPVAFFIDPALANDPNMDDVGTITLSYSFFKVGSSALDLAMEDFYNQPANTEGPRQTGK